MLLRLTTANPKGVAPAVQPSGLPAIYDLRLTIYDNIPPMVTVRWKDEAMFEADVPSGAKFFLDTHPDYGGRTLGPTPVEALLASIAACSAIDVLDILKKKRQVVTSYRVEVDGDRPPPGNY